MIITYSKGAVKAISRLDYATKQRIKKAIEQLPAGDVKRLQGREVTYRLRVGGWRILFAYLANDTIHIEKIAPRGQAYKEG